MSLRADITTTADPIIKMATHEDRREVTATPCNDSACDCTTTVYARAEVSSATPCNDSAMDTSQSQVTAIAVGVSLGVLAGIMASAAVVSCSIMVCDGVYSCFSFFVGIEC